MLATNLKIIAVTLTTIFFYTFLANAIPQVESEVPTDLALGAEFTTVELVSAGENLYLGAGGCTACHGTGTRAPNLDAAEGSAGPIGERCGTRAEGVPCKEYLHESLVNPTAYVVEGYQPIMPDMSRTLSDAQIWALVAYMESLGGEVTVAAEDIEASASPAAAAPAAAAAPPAAVASTTTDPLELLRENQCTLCHQIGDEGGAIGPPLTGIGGRLDTESIRRSILEPNADTTSGYETVAGTMPPTFGEQLTAAQLETIVQYLATQR